MNQKIIASIREYASAYDCFQQLQDLHPAHLPIGDQKTGVIGEFYAMLFARSVYSGCSVNFAHPTQPWDIEISGEQDILIQVKAVSAYSKTRIISPIFPGWDHLYLLSLDRALLPDGFWVVTDPNIFSGRESLRSQKMRSPVLPNGGSLHIPFGENRVAELHSLIAP
ncbi:MAG: hypothetical protein WCP45_08585 [Verrucomicrobiota bacterium]